MDKNVLKKFAIESRQDLMQRMENKIKTFYIDEKFSKQQSGDVYILANNKHSLNLSKEEYDKRELLIKRINELGLEQVIEEAAYTWFNRIVAIRYMEIHDYLPLTRDNQSLGIRVLSSKDNTPDPEIMKFTNLVNPELDIDFKKEKYVELNDDNEKFKYILLLVCRKLGRVIPQVFDGITDYIDILVPDNLLNESGFVNKLVTEVPVENYEQVEIIGWLYQYYNCQIKEEVENKGYMLDKKYIPVMTQFYTPDWIVQYMVQNTLGRYWIEHGGKNSLIKNWKYFINNNLTIKAEQIDPKYITCIDPCMGSGHILVYMFDILFQIYESYGYNQKDIAELILRYNLHGLDIDDRAGQLSILSVLLKARSYDKNIFNKINTIDYHIKSIQEIKIDGVLLNEFSQESQLIVKKLMEIYKDAKEKGALITFDKLDLKVIKNELGNNLTILGYELNSKLQPIFEQTEILSKKYNVVVTNPPYLGIKKYNKNLLKFITDNYTDLKYDLFSCFIERNSQLLGQGGHVGMITQQTWLNIDSFEKLRLRMINNYGLNTVIHLGYNAIDGGMGTAAFTFNNVINKKTTFIDLTSSTNKEIDFFNVNNIYTSFLEDYASIPKTIFIYKSPEKIRKCFKIDSKVGDFCNPKSGLVTRNNNLFLRNWYEVSLKNIEFNCDEINFDKKWYPHVKGGTYRKWFGNYEQVVNWKDNGKDIRKYTENANGGSIVGSEYYFKSGLTWSLSTFSTKFSLRYLPKGFIYNVEAPSLFDIKEFEYIFGLLNSKIGGYFLDIVSDDLHYKTKDVSNVPYIYNIQYRTLIKEIVKENVELSKQDWNSFETSWNFKHHPFITFKSDITRISEIYNEWEKYCSNNFYKLKNNEEKLNDIFINIYNLNNDILPDIDNNEITISMGNVEREIKSLISYAVGCMLGRYSLDEDGIVYAGGEFDKSRYKKFEADSDNIIPITDEAYFDDDIVQRFRKFIEVSFGKETLNENLDFIADTLGKKGTETSEETIRRYFVNDFFNDHCKIYQKRPIYWLLDSGKKNGFKVLIYMHRYDENLIPKVRINYLHRVQTTYEKLLSDVNYKLTTDLSMVDKKDAQKRQADLNAKLQEIKEYDEKIAHIANQRISIDLDDGVKVNYEKFKDILAKIR